ncbi:MAG: N-acetylmuramoyl-L-alanine amidase [Dysgonamonadaceae bacterium]|jgi:N-acetylmuramoyl-L-alanine amidase|nr:N-acetylmuramoyl-L-alanine amidase [Dysgonamonadaceae bacterium]
MSFIRIWCILICFQITFFADAQEKDKPQRGEGVHAFLRRHNRDNNQYYQVFIKSNKGKFGKRQSLLSGVYYQLPPVVEDSNKPDDRDISDNMDTLDAGIFEISGEVDNYKPQPAINKKLKTGYRPLFGKKYAKYTIVDQELADACFFLSSGHGGPDSGAIAKVNGRELHEDEYAYDITLRLARNLLQHGAIVYIIIQDPKDGIRDGKYLNNSQKETCMGKKIPLDQLARLQQRTDKINSLCAKSKGKYQRAVFIHLDSRSKKKQLDVFFYYQDKPENRRKSKRLAETMRKTFADRYAKVQPGRGFSGTVSTRNLAVLRNAKPISIFMELVNMQNEFDQRRYILDDNRQALANWMTLGFIRDYRNSK